jgi:hypothetical protein
MRIMRMPGGTSARLRRSQVTILAKERQELDRVCQPAGGGPARLSCRDYFTSRMKVGTRPAIELNELPPAEIQLEHPSTLPR